MRPRFLSVVACDLFIFTFPAYDTMKRLNALTLYQEGRVLDYQLFISGL